MNNITIDCNFFKNGNNKMKSDIFYPIVDILKNIESKYKTILYKEFEKIKNKIKLSLGSLYMEVNCEHYYQLSCNVGFYVVKYQNKDVFCITFSNWVENNVFIFDLDFPMIKFLYLFYDFVKKDGYIK